jgi:hypothetical protein
MAYDIYMHNKPQEGTTPLSAESPTSNATESPNLTVKSGVMLGYGAMVAQKGYSNLVQDVKAGGNDELSNTLSNVGTVATKAVMAYATGGLSLIPEAINVTGEVIMSHRERERNNRVTEIQNSLRGVRVNFGRGAANND